MTNDKLIYIIQPFIIFFPDNFLPVNIWFIWQGGINLQVVF